MPTPDYHIVVTHGSLNVNVPRSLFKGTQAVPDEDAVKKFRKMLRERYPWLTENAMDVFMRNARRIMLETIDRETAGRAKSRELAAEGRIEEAIKHIRRHLEQDPNDADLWYLLGELLCKAGRADEGYAAMNRGRDLF